MGWFSANSDGRPSSLGEGLCTLSLGGAAGTDSGLVPRLPEGRFKVSTRTLSGVLSTLSSHLPCLSHTPNWGCMSTEAMGTGTKGSAGQLTALPWVVASTKIG